MTGSPRWVRDGSVAALVVATAAGLLTPDAVEALRWVPLLAGLVVTGMPHGAIDHLVPGRLRGRPLSPPQLAGLLGAYVALAAAGVALWLLAPAAGLVAFLAVAAVHWGQGEVWFLVHVEGRGRPRDAAGYVAVVLARGLLPVLGPLALHPRAAGEAIGQVLAPLDRPVDVPAVSPAAGAVVVAIALLAGVVAASRDGGGGRRRDLTELVVLAAFVAVTPPVFAIGLYFVAWHAPRHLVRLATLEPQAPHPWRRVMAAAAPCTTVALVAVAAVAVVLAVDPTVASAVAGAALAVVFGLTIPHTLLVAWMDHAQGVLPAARCVPASRRRVTGSSGRPPCDWSAWRPRAARAVRSRSVPGSGGSRRAG